MLRTNMSVIAENMKPRPPSTLAAVAIQTEKLLTMNYKKIEISRLLIPPSPHHNAYLSM